MTRTETAERPRETVPQAEEQERRPTVVLIDANGLVYRAFFALPYFTTSDGRPTNAVYGFTTMVLKILDEVRPDYVAAAFDRAAPTFRHVQYREYKATRQRMPDDLRPQLALAKEILQALAVPIFEVDGYEADDVLGTIARQAAADGADVLIVTGDLDVLQLVDDRIRVMVTSRGITDTTVYDAEAFRARFGFEPARLPDYKGLTGDPTDNLPGVPGVGEKTARQLIQRFGTLDALLARVDQAPPKLRDVLRAHADQMRESRRLATIVTDVPVRWTWDDLRRRPPDRARLQALLADLEFKSLLERLGAVSEAPAGQYRQVDPATLARTVNGAAEVGLHLVREPGHPLTARLVGVAVCAAPGQAVYLPVDDAVPAEVRALLEGPARKVSGDAKADLHTLRRLGLSPRGLDFDVGIASYLLNPGRRTHSLETAAWEFLGWRLQEAGEGGGLGLDRDPAADACRAADALLRLRPLLEERMREREVYDLFTQIEMPLAAVLAAMEAAGVAVDVPYLRELSAELERRLAELTAEIYRLAGTEFNISSPRQLAFVLFEKLRLPPVKKTKTGYSTDAEVLEYLAPQHEIVAKIVAHRELTKLKTTYVDVLPAMVHPATGRVHATFNQTVAATGRVITTDPNLQNLPIRTDEGRKIRRAIVAEPGRLLLGADYSQIDLRVLAHITRDPGLVDAFTRGDDIHAVTASELFGVPREGVTPDLRRRAKTIVFGVAYGMSEFGVAAQLGISKTEARAYIERYYERYPGVRRYMQEIVEQARRDGYVTTLLRRRRYIPEVHTRNRPIREAAERTAINTPIQGSSADIIKKAMVDLFRQVLPRYPGALMILQIHDELLFEAPAADVPGLAREVREVMERTYPLAVPLRVDLKAGPNWRDMEPLA
ncbi:MAG: DNA polymerase I [Armatimonadota bacterium]|nr:DNA polymerase I [Armatimonadota bacterium]MDR7516049.1 DNA polymerase I [Armatimonadota bacterium]MDR7560383.1 DNA polymerase I [Armatimonadota bacterium]MDR7583675.1 DNA polymerase I [Armatimonadota bacterium]MDR7588706.1 DNA polymerase I [Armatimonadota bacterium]